MQKNRWKFPEIERDPGGAQEQPIVFARGLAWTRRIGMRRFWAHGDSLRQKGRILRKGMPGDAAIVVSGLPVIRALLEERPDSVSRSLAVKRDGEKTYVFAQTVKGVVDLELGPPS